MTPFRDQYEFDGHSTVATQTFLIIQDGLLWDISNSVKNSSLSLWLVSSYDLLLLYLAGKLCYSKRVPQLKYYYLVTGLIIYDD